MPRQGESVPKRPGSPAIYVRIAPEMLLKVKAWGRKHKVGLPEAFRQLAEIGWAVEHRSPARGP
jgi:hypothetical protein